METWLTSDLHLGHSNIVTYCNRPFTKTDWSGERIPDVDAMNEALIDNWNDTVSEDDVVWVLGDVALGKIAETLPLVSLLKGQKFLVPGNHDRCWHRHKKYEKWLQRYLDAGFVDIFNQDAVTLGSRRILMSHFPYTGDSRHEDRYSEARPLDRGLPLLHGHVHDSWRQQGRQINVGVDVWGYKPVNLDQLLELL